jgi:hypothetical protein
MAGGLVDGHVTGFSRADLSQKCARRANVAEFAELDWQNSSSNWQNTSQDWRNSPQNWANSAQNYNNANGIYDRDGNRVGYAVPRADGSGINYFDNSGRRTGYQNYENR